MTTGILRACRAFIGLCAWLVPSGRRDDWRAEWHAELWSLADRSVRIPARYPRPSIALLAFTTGAFAHALAEFRQVWNADLLWYEFRQALRFLLRHRVFSLTSAVLIALGVGANTAVFSLVNAVLLRAPLGIEAPQELAQIGRGGADARDFDSWSYPLYRDLRARTRSFGDLAAHAMFDVTIGQDGDVVSANAQLVSANYFRVLGAPLARGRAFLDEEDEAGLASVTVISDGLWRRRYALDPEVVGKTMTVRGRPFRIVGVAKPEFSGADIGAARPDLWIPLAALSTIAPGRAERLQSPFMSWIWIVGRLKPGVTVAAAQSELSSVFRQLQQERDGEVRDGVLVIGGLGLRPDERALASVISGALLAIVAAVLLVACANLAALLLARGVARQVEINIRLAIGASRGRVVRQLVLETFIVAVVGSTAAFVATRWTARLIEQFLPYPVAVSLTPDVRVLAFALVLGVGTSALFGVLPAWRSTNGDLLSLLRTSASGATPGGRRLRAMLFVGQVALSFTLLASTGLLVRTVLVANRLDPGFRTDDILVGAVDVQAGDSSSTRTQLTRLEQVVARVSAEPGVLGATLASAVPATGTMFNRTMWPIDGATGDAPMSSVSILVVDTAYFHVMGVPIIRGRQFDGAMEPPGLPTNIIVNEAFARRVWPGKDAVGQMVAFGLLSGEQRMRVVGVARDARNRSLRAPPAPQAYLPFAQNPAGSAMLHVRIAPGHPSMTTSLSARIHMETPGAPPVHFVSMRSYLARSLADIRLIGVLGATFGGLALVLATVGIYGVVSFETSSRAREYGVRLALGARPSGVRMMVLARSAQLSALGILLGLGATAAVTPFMRQWIFGVAPYDPLTLVCVASVLCLTTALAAFGPAARAARSDPMTSLRSE